MILRREFLTAVPLTAAPIAALLQAAPRVGGVKIGCQTNAWRIDPVNGQGGVLAEEADEV